MILDQIIADTRVALEKQKLAHPAGALRELLPELPATTSFSGSLRRPGVSIVAEIKRASPSRGPLNIGLRPADMATTYASGGADAMSILTEPTRFRGSLSDLREARSALQTAGLSCPLLRKDFIIDPYQILEARVWGADAVLLIAAGLDDAMLARLFEETLALDLTPLIEVHDECELTRTLRLNPPVVGINNRNLKDFSVDLQTTRELRPLVPPTCVVISESGIRKAGHMRELAALGVDAALIGEALVTAPDPGAMLKDLKEAGR